MATKTVKLYKERVEILSIHPYKVLVDGRLRTPPGVTTITGQFAKEAIPQWAANLASETALKLAGTRPDSEVYDIARKRYLEVRDDAADGGKEGHKWIEAYIQGELEDTHFFESEHSINVVEGYLEFEQDYPITSQEPEKLLYSIDYDYGGMRDNLGVNRDKQLLTLDFKTGNPDFEYSQNLKRYTGKARAYPNHFGQCGGYDIAESEESGRMSDAYGVLYLPKQPQELVKKYGTPFKRYFYFETSELQHWKEWFLNARRAWSLANIQLNPYQVIKEYKNE